MTTSPQDMNASIKYFAERYNTSETALHWLGNIKAYEDQGIINAMMCELLITQSRLLEMSYKRRHFAAVKTLFDFTVATTLLVLLLPLFVLIALAIKLESKGPVFFLQTRFGQFCAPFKIYKFRTMHEGAERKIPFIGNTMRGGLFKAKNDPRITRVGEFLRKTSLDELPQLFNILLGNMSLVGPRPLPAEDTSTISNKFIGRFSVKPGITGLWQVTIRGSDDGLQKIRLDCHYAETYSWKMDLYILAKTLPVVLTREGAS